jgi:tetratricopeptide (TPR) repeat protein
MKDLLIKLVFLFGISLFLCFSSCAHLEKEPVAKKEPAPQKEPVPQEEPAKEKEPAKEEIYDSIKIAQKYLAEGDIQKALETYNDAHIKNPDDTTLRSNYIKAIEHIKKNADAAFVKEEYASAGFMYHTLLNNCQHAKSFVSSLSFDKDYLSNRVESCSKILLEKGLVQYREGNLKEAISIWKTILTFDPENGEVKKAIETATIQLKNLQKQS